MSSGVNTDTYLARIRVDPLAPKFRECRADNDESRPVPGVCIQ